MRSARARSWIGWLCSCAVLACTLPGPARPPALELVPGWPLADAPPGCRPLYWQAPDGETLALCPDEAARIPIERRELFAAGLRESSEQGETWYWVGLYLDAELRRRIEAALDRGPDRPLRPYALRMEGEALRIDPEGGPDFALALTATRARERAEALARALDVPLVRETRPAAGEQPAIVPLLRILADPTRWLGQRVSVTGFLAGHTLEPASELFLSRSHAQAYDLASALHVADPSPDGALARSACAEHWVSIEGTVSSRAGPLLVNLELTQVADVRLSAPPFSACWPEETEPAAP